jgi:hypothetical protein
MLDKKCNDVYVEMEKKIVNNFNNSDNKLNYQSWLDDEDIKTLNNYFIVVLNIPQNKLNEYILILKNNKII